MQEDLEGAAGLREAPEGKGGSGFWLACPPTARPGKRVGGRTPVATPPSPPLAHHARLVFREESVLGAKAPWPTECPPPSLPALRADPTPAFNRAQQNRFLSPNLSAKISQHRSENLSCYTVNFTESIFPLGPNPLKVACPAPQQPISRPKQKVGRIQMFVWSLLPPGVSTEQRPFMPSSVLGV